tara:strand:- start:3837 stop:4598 length:762 start_codon:yes stop_codon:yes gene_type:complete
MIEQSNDNFLYSIIIPMFNEEKNAYTCVNEVLKAVKKIETKGLIIVVNDGSNDKTKIILNELKSIDELIKVESYKKNEGYGYAIYRGVRIAKQYNSKYVLFMDSDLTNNPIYIQNFVNKMKEDYDFIKASRYEAGGGTKNVPLKRKIISIIGNYVIKSLVKTKFTDITNGFRAIKTKHIQNIHMKEKGFPVIMEEMYILSLKSIKEVNVPIILENRNNGKSSFNYTLLMFYLYLKYPILSFLVSKCKKIRRSK